MRDFAAMVGISNPYLSQIERGLRAPSDTVLTAIAESLRTSSDALLEEAGIPRNEHVSLVVEAIRADIRLTASQRRALIEIYKAYTN